MKFHEIEMDNDLDELSAPLSLPAKWPDNKKRYYKIFTNCGMSFSPALL